MPRDLVAVELLDDRGEPFEPRDLLARLNPLPPKQKSLEVRRVDRRDLGAEPVQGVAMNPGQQAAFAPFEVRGVGVG